MNFLLFVYLDKQVESVFFKIYFFEIVPVKLFYCLHIKTPIIDCYSNIHLSILNGLINDFTFL